MNPRLYRYNGAAWDSGSTLYSGVTDNGPAGLAVDGDGSIFVVDNNTDRFYEFEGNDQQPTFQTWDMGTALPSEGGLAAGIAIDPSNWNVLVLDRDDEKFYRLIGSMWDTGTALSYMVNVLRDPVGLTVDPSNNDVVVWDSFNQQYYRYDGSTWDTGTSISDISNIGVITIV